MYLFFSNKIVAISLPALVAREYMLSEFPVKPLPTHEPEVYEPLTDGELYIGNGLVCSRIERERFALKVRNVIAHF